MKKLKPVMFLLFIVLTSLIWGLSMQDANHSNQVSQEVTRTISSSMETIVPPRLQVTVSNNMIRDLAHISLFFLLGLISMLGFLLYQKTYLSASLYTFILGSFIALTDECIQLRSVGRAFELVDIGKDLLGVLISIILAGILYLLILLFKHLLSRLNF